MKSAVHMMCAVFACVLPAISPAADTDSTDTAATTESQKVSRFRDPKDGQIDLSSFLAQPRAFLATINGRRTTRRSPCART